MTIKARELLRKCSAFGVQVVANGEALMIRGPAEAKPVLRAELVACKAELLRILSEEQAELFEERAAIAEYDGGLPRAEAEALARSEAFRRATSALLSWKPTELPN